MYIDERLIGREVNTFYTKNTQRVHLYEGQPHPVLGRWKIPI